MTPPSRRPRRLLVALALVLAWVTSGCMTITYDLRVEGDGSGEMYVELLFSEELADQMGGSSGGLPVGDLADMMGQGLPPDVADAVDIEGVDRDGRTGLGIRVRFDDVEELSRLQAATGAAAGEQPVQDLSVTRTEDGWRFDARVDGAAGTPGGDPELEAALGEAFSQAMAGFGDFEVRYAVTLPGRLVETNATEVDGSTARWTFTMDEQGPTRIYAISGPGGGLPVAWLMVGVAVALVALVAGVVLLRRRGVTTLPDLVVTADPGPAGGQGPPAHGGPPTAPPPVPGPPSGGAPLGGVPPAGAPPPQPSPWAPPAGRPAPTAPTPAVPPPTAPTPAVPPAGSPWAPQEPTSPPTWSPPPGPEPSAPPDDRPAP